MPKTPGSKRVPEDRAGMGRARFTGAAARMVAARRRQRRSQAEAMARNPQSQTARAMAGIGSAAGLSGCDGGVMGSLTVKGWLAMSTMTARVGGVDGVGQ